MSWLQLTLPQEANMQKPIPWELLNMIFEKPCSFFLGEKQKETLHHKVQLNRICLLIARILRQELAFLPGQRRLHDFFSGVDLLSKIWQVVNTW